MARACGHTHSVGGRPVRGKRFRGRGALREMAHQGGFGGGAVRIGLLGKKGGGVVGTRPGRNKSG